MIRRILVPGVVLLLIPGLLFAHVGNPNTVFDGKAGPYPVRIVVRTPGVVPGLAEISIRTAPSGVDRVTAQPVKWDAGRNGAPPADVARQLPGEPSLYDTQLWLMDSGAYSIYVTVAGSKGSGTAIVPVNSVATKRLPMTRPLGITLSFLALILLVGAVSVTGAAVREAVLAPGESPDPRRRRRAALVMVLTFAFLAVVLLGGERWWSSVDSAYRAKMYMPLHIRTSLAGPSTLRINIDDPQWQGHNWTPVVPDHGKLMHCFLIREPKLDVFAHLHPVPRSRAVYEGSLPPLPPGRYRLYADITHESGFAETLVDSITLPQIAPSPAGDADDAWTMAPREAQNAATDRLPDGYTIAIVSGDLRSGAESTLRFSITGPGGRPALIEPYMGMAAHAVITNADGSLFVHLHPMGTVSMASQQLFAARDAGQRRAGIPGSPAAMSGGMDKMDMTPTASTFELPFDFPAAGNYRVFVQVRSGGSVRTGVFDLHVA